jgi:hypothetical protein
VCVFLAVNSDGQRCCIRFPTRSFIRHQLRVTCTHNEPVPAGSREMRALSSFPGLPARAVHLAPLSGHLPAFIPSLMLYLCYAVISRLKDTKPLLSGPVRNSWYSQESNPYEFHMSTHPTSANHKYFLEQKEVLLNIKHFFHLYGAWR